MNGLNWYAYNAKHHTGSDDGIPWGWVYWGCCWGAAGICAPQLEQNLP